MDNKLVVVIMGPGNENFLDMCRESVKGAEEILYFTSNPKRHNGLEEVTFFNEWDESDKQTNGKSRNVYLKLLKRVYPDDWCLVLDEDEVCEDINKIKEFIQTAEPGLYSPKMRHFIGDLGHEDATNKIHYVPNRLFKISEAMIYPLESHPVLVGKVIGTTDCTTIWHLGHLPIEYMKYIVKRYNQHNNDSVIHTKQFLKNWRDAHLYGLYPTTRINPVDIPNVILDNFNIDFEELYFRNRKEMKAQHYQDAIDWKEFFLTDGCFEDFILFGCGVGQRVYALNKLDDCSAIGVELSKYAVKNALHKNVEQGDILTFDYTGTANTVVAYDILEHLNYKDLDKAIENLIQHSREYILISVPFKGTPNCDADPTHIIKEERGWWINKFIKAGCKVVKTPDHFQFKEQILIFKKEVKNGKS